MTWLGPRGFRRMSLGVALLWIAAACTHAQAPSAKPVAGPNPTLHTVSSAIQPNRSRPHPRTIVAAGDISATSIAHQRETSNLVRRLGPTRVLALGDLQYNVGAYDDFRAYYDPTWGRFKGRTIPAPGNHEYETPDAAGYFRYFGDAAAPHGRSYFSVNVGRWHLISLNSNIDRDGKSPQARWLRRDLRATTSDCMLAFWHHPLFSSGSHHGGDDSVLPFWRALFHARADVVLNGHEHNYERFARQAPNGHANRNGIREYVSGAGGKSLYPFASAQPHSQDRVEGRYGVLEMVLRSHSYTWRFVAVGGAVLDKGGPVRCH
jgi:hypothetical protein